MTEKARERAGELTDQAKEQAKGQTSKQKDRAAERLSGFARALHKTSDNLREEENHTTARYVDQAAGQAERASGYLRDHSTDDLVRETERLARRQPGLFLGGAFALGLLGARFLKSSGRGSSHSSPRQAKSRGPEASGQYRERPERTEPAGRPRTRTSAGTEPTPGG